MIIKKMLFLFPFLVFILFLLFVVFQNNLNYQENLKLHSASSLDIIGQRMDSLVFEINNFPRTASGEILFLSSLSSIQNFVNSSELFKDELVGYVEEDFLNFMGGNDAYYQLRYLDLLGNEIVRVDFDGEARRIVPTEELQYKSQRYYFNEVINLDKGDIFISKIDLNLERGVLENRGSEENPIYISVLRYATPVFNKMGYTEGMIVSNIYADYFLEDIRRFEKENEIFYLIDENGYYLAHPNRTKEFSFMFDGKYNFKFDYPEVSEKILGLSDDRIIESEDSIFTYKYIFPSLGSFEIHSGMEKVLGTVPEEKQFWVLVGVSDKEEINRGINKLKRNKLFNEIFIFIFGIIFIFIFIVYYLISLDEKKFYKRRNG